MPENGLRIISQPSRRTVAEFWGDDAETQLETWRTRNPLPWGYTVEGCQRPTEAERAAQEREKMRLIQRRTGTGGYDTMGMLDDDGPRQKGRALGMALAKLIGISASADYESMMVLGMWMSEQEGYRELKSGSLFMNGFVSGFQEAAAPLAPKSIASGSNSSGESSAS